MKSVILIILLLGFVFSCKVDSEMEEPETNPNPEIQGRVFGGTRNDAGYDVKQTSDGGYIIAGITESYGAGGSDIYLLKLNPSLELEWEKTYGGSANDFSTSVVETPDGGFTILGVTASSGAGSDDFYLINTDNNGNEIWSNTYGGAELEHATSLLLDSDGGYLLCGVTMSFGNSGQVYLVKTDSLGQVTWSGTYGGSGYEYADCINHTTDGGFIISGYTNSIGHGADDFFLLKIDSSYNEVWFKAIGGSSNDWGHDSIQLSDGGYLVTGVTCSFGAGGWDAFLIKTDSNGEVIWQNTYGGAGGNGSEEEYTNSLYPTSDGGVILFGATNSFGSGSNDFFLIRVDSLGNELWNKTFGGSSSEGGSDFCRCADGGYLLCGVTSSYGSGGEDIYVIKVDAEGNVE